MKVLVDTCVWSQALRHKNPDKNITQKLSDLINDGRAVLIGPIKQELLSGIRRSTQFEKLKLNLQAFPDLPLESEDYESAAEFFNICYKKGIQGSNTDYLICALSFRHQMPIFTIDKDFQHFKKYLPISIYKIKK